MGFRDKYHDTTNKIFAKVSLRAKMIIFIILSIIVVGIAYKTSVDNKKPNSIIENTNKIDKDKPAEIKEGTPSDNRTLEEEKLKRLDKKYEGAEKLFSDKKYSDVVSSADEIIKEDSNFYKAYNIKGIALCYNNNYEDGMKNIDKALELKPDFGYARFNKALAYELYGKYDQSLQWYDKALEIENYVWSYYGKASIYGRRGDVDNTIKFLKIAINMSPDIKEVAREEEDFNPVKSSKEFKDLIK